MMYFRGVGVLLAAVVVVVEGFLGDPTISTRHSYFRIVQQESMYLPHCPYWPRPQLLDGNNLPPSVADAVTGLDAKLESFFASLNIPSAHVIATAGESIVFEKGYGSKTIPTSGSVFRIASNTKVFTTLLMYRLRDEGLIRSLDDPIAAYAPDFAPQNPFDPNQKVTFRQLASHMGGLGRECPCNDPLSYNVCAHNSSIIFSRYQSQYLFAPPDTIPSYSNMGFATIGNVLGMILHSKSVQMKLGLDTTACDQTTLAIETCLYEEAVRQLIFSELGFTCTAFSHENVPNGSVVTGYVGEVPVPDYSLGWMSPTGQIYACNEDLQKLLAFLMADETLIPARPLPGSTLREMFLMRYVNDDRRTGFGTPWEMYHMPVNEAGGGGAAERGTWIHTKSGMVPGYVSNIGFAQDLQLGVAVLVSVAPPYGALPDAFWMTFSNLLGPISAYYRSFAQAPTLPENADDYVGSYVAKQQSVTTPLPIFMRVAREGDNELTLYTHYATGGQHRYGQITQFQQRHGDQEYFTLVPQLTNGNATYTSSCSSLEGGYNFQNVVFTRNSRGKVAYMTIESLYYGVNFIKSKF